MSSPRVIDPRQTAVLCGAFLLVLALAILSVGIGAEDFRFLDVLSEHHSLQLLLDSRVPRTLAVTLSGVSLAIAGLLMQVIVRNRFTEPATTGTTEAAMLGALVLTIVAPGAQPIIKMMLAGVFALAGSAMYLALLRRAPVQNTYLAPLIGLVFGGVIHSIATFLAYRYGLVQSLFAWSAGDFSVILRGRYELLWIGFALAVLAFVLADRYTVVGMGRAYATNLGLSYGRLRILGLMVISGISAVTVVTAGNIPFLGLVVPNLVRLACGDNLRKTIPWVALSGGAFALICDITGRVVIYPFEIPVGTIIGVVGSVLLLMIIRVKGAHVE
ncbi:ABC transporter permease [Pseudomonas aeruginosa]|uniref:ABC transporter permease n=1 Tax=Pseudomonas aeruginosa TaxID=287 RepID=UPI000BB8970C|nr:iron chelate uptake ABC transporter family permease subunit [Pseudomonas aeruginosa]MBH4114819.1 iron chelate uptake ABC transporter family permease subunit [Pseudomonas aeruginosa]MCO2409899.1 ABC transporter permease [Pseudomonas aeruginosa]MCO3481901.1 ABC transporter permease [Pseudomonas aeruginosa]MCO3717080.1 ABC transporter permease [Pseudomonas aeruginosa]PBV25608.1 iron ABC transporter permease [Pseudomonas aeruginosa]